jgi:iron-sulfur cluster repair protein YtfE (RIC family)
MRITDALLGEHGVFYAQFDHFESCPDDDDLDCVKRRAAQLAAALEPHAILENELLFDALEARGGELTGLLSVMREEHREIEAALHDIQHAASLVRARALLRDMIRTAREHFEKEELVAFPLAEERLTEEELGELGSLWAQRRGVRAGVARSEAGAPVERRQFAP